MELSQQVKVVKGLPGQWERSSRTIPLYRSSFPRALTCWKDLIAVGFGYLNENHPSMIITLDAITGAHLSVISGDVGWVSSLIFSPDGTSLVSGGGSGGVIKLWDTQTGGVVKTFCGHTDRVASISISLDCTTIASGSWDNTIRLWDVQTGVCHCIIDQHSDLIHSVSFSPTNPHLLISASRDNTVQWWDTNGHQIGPAYEGQGVAFSLDGVYFVSWGGSIATVRTSDSGEVIVELQAPSGGFECCDFSLDGKFMAGGVGNNIYIWNITSSDPSLVESLIGHTDTINSLKFSSLLISLSQDGSIKLWQYGASSIVPDATTSGSTPTALAPIKNITLQTNDGIAISHDLAGVVRVWDVSTGLCKTTIQTPTQYLPENGLQGDMRIIDDRLIFVWYGNTNFSIWDTKKQTPPQVVDIPYKHQATLPVISWDGSKVFSLVDEYFQVWSIQTGEVTSKVKTGRQLCKNLIVHGSRVWVHFKDSQTKGWDFGVSGSDPIPLSGVAPDGPDPVLKFKQGDANKYRIEDKLTGTEFFQLSGRYACPSDLKWDGQHLVAGYGSGEVLILDFTHMLLQQGYMAC